MLKLIKFKNLHRRDKTSTLRTPRVHRVIKHTYECSVCKQRITVSVCHVTANDQDGCLNLIYQYAIEKHNATGGHQLENVTGNPNKQELAIWILTGLYGTNL